VTAHPAAMNTYQDRFTPHARDLCNKLLAKDPDTRLGKDGCVDVMLHPWFGDLDWDRLAQVLQAMTLVTQQTSKHHCCRLNMSRVPYDTTKCIQQIE
jgi:hypothetical protein